MEFTIIDHKSGENSQFTNDRIVDFLYEHLDQYGDERKDIMNCLNYMYERGGFATVGHEGDDIKGIIIINETGMSGYIPENILVYIAVDNSSRGKGYGRKLMEKVLGMTKGDVALHVEPDNPARFLYENVGFTNKYLEMRYKNPV